MEEPPVEAICIRRFLQEFDHAIGEDVQLRGGIVGSYSLPPEDVEGEVTDWALQYLEQRKCPYTLAVVLAKTVAQQLGASVHQRVSQSNGSSKEEGTKQLLDSSQLHMETINNLHELCSHWKDRPEIEDLGVSCDYDIRHVTSVCAIKNGRRKMEDRHVVLHDLMAFCGLEDAPHHSYYAVFDGHAGVDAASFAAAHLHKNIVNHPAFLTDPETAIRVAFRLTDEQFLDRSSREGIKSGCTAVCTIIREQTLYLAWLGDSQATLIREGNAVPIMIPHKPDREDEKQRIKELGGYVIFNGTWRVSGTLAVSRALGDPEYKPFVSSEPDVVTIPFDGSEDFLILACDGLWDRLSPSDAAATVYYHLANSSEDIDDVATKLVHQAKELGSSDNITTIVVFLKDLPSLIASAQNYSIHFPQVLQTESRTHSLINGDNHLLECHSNDSLEQGVEKPNVLNLSSGFDTHCPQDYNVGNPFSDFLEQTSENGPAGPFRYQTVPKGMAPEATALSELPTPPIDEIIAAQQFEMASDNNPFRSQQDLMNTLELQIGAECLPSQAGGEGHVEAKELASEIVNLTIETAVRQVSATPPPPDYSLQEHQEDSGLEEGPLEDLEQSPEHGIELQSHGIIGTGSGVLSPYAEPFYPASLRTQDQNITSGISGGLDFSQNLFIENENIDKSAASEGDVGFINEHTSDVGLDTNNAPVVSLINQCDNSQLEQNVDIIMPELGTVSSEVAFNDNQDELNLFSNNLIGFDQESQKFETKTPENSLMDMEQISLVTSDPEKDVEISSTEPISVAQLSLGPLSSSADDSDMLPINVNDSPQTVQEIETNLESTENLKQLIMQAEGESYDGSMSFQNSEDMFKFESNVTSSELDHEICTSLPYDSLNHPSDSLLNVASTDEQKLICDTLPEDSIAPYEETLQKMTEDITCNIVEVDKQSQNNLQSPAVVDQTDSLLEHSFQDVALATTLSDISLSKNVEAPLESPLFENTMPVPDVSEIPLMEDSAQVPNMSEIPLMEVPDVSEIHPVEDTAQVPQVSEIPLIEDCVQQIPDVSEIPPMEAPDVSEIHPVEDTAQDKVSQIPLMKNTAQIPNVSEVSLPLDTSSENLPQAPLTDVVQAFMLVEDIAQATKMSEMPLAEDIVHSPILSETPSDVVQAPTLSKSPVASDDMQVTTLSEIPLAEEPIDLCTTDPFEVSDTTKKDTSAEESPHLQPIATSSPISSEIQTVNINEHIPENIDLLEPSLLVKSVSSVQKTEVLTSNQYIEPLSSTGPFIPEIPATLLEVAGVPTPADSLADDIPQGTAAVIEGIPDSVPEAEGVTEDVDSDSEKDGGWSYIKVEASQKPSVTKTPEPSVTKTPSRTSKIAPVPPSDGKVNKQPGKSAVKTIKKDTGKPLDVKPKSKPGVTEKIKLVSTAAHSEKIDKEKGTVAKSVGAKSLPSQKRQVAATSSVRKVVPQSRPATKTTAGLPSTNKQPATSTSTLPSTVTKTCPSVQKEQKQPVSSGPVATKPPTQCSVPAAAKTTSTSKSRPSLTTRPASAPIGRCKDVPSSQTPVTKPGSASTRLSSTEAVRKTLSRPMSTPRQTPPKRPTSTLSTPKPETKNGQAPGQELKETKKIPSNTFKVPSSGAVRKSVPKMETKQTKDNVNKQISAKTPQPKEKPPSALSSGRTKKPDVAKQTQSTGKLEPKLVTKRPSTGTTPRTSTGKGPIQSKDLKSKQPLKGNQTVRSKPESISEPKKDSKDLQTPDQEKGSLEANNRETAMGDSSGATPETPVSSSVTSSVSEEQTAIKAKGEDICLDTTTTTTTTTHIEGSQH